MTWPQLCAQLVTWSIVLWWIFHTRGEYTRGYRKALDHVEEMTRPGRRPGRYTLEGALETLRKEL